jgi:hypothetical protein
MLRIVYGISVFAGLYLGCMIFTTEKEFRTSSLGIFAFVALVVYVMSTILMCSCLPRVKTHNLTISLEALLIHLVTASISFDFVAGIFVNVLAYGCSDPSLGYWTAGLFWSSFVLMISAGVLGLHMAEKNKKVAYAIAV